MSAQFSTPTDELLLLAETLGEVKSRTEKLETEFSTQARPLEAATNALSAALSGIKALQFHVLDNNLGALSARVEGMRKAVDEQVGVIALELKKADETNAAKAGADAEALRSEIVALQSQLGSLVTQFGQQLERVEFAAKEEAKKLELIPGPAGAAGASLNPRGTFIDGEVYNRLDVVSWLGSSYIATVDGVTEKPSKNSNQWQTLASRGGGGAGGVGDFGSLAGVAQINQGGTGQTTRVAALNALLPDQAGSTQYMLLTDGSGTVSWGAQPVAGLPSQTSNSGKLLTTDGTNASWSGAVTVSGSNATIDGILKLGSTANSDDAALLFTRAITSQGATGSHAFHDATTINTSTGLKAYASGDAQPVMTLAAASNHLRGFQARPELVGGAYTISEVAPFQSQATITSGTATNVYGLRVDPSLGAGANGFFAAVLVNDVGNSLSTAGVVTPTSAYSFYHGYTAPIYNGGNIQSGAKLIGQTLRVTNFTSTYGQILGVDTSGDLLGNPNLTIINGVLTMAFSTAKVLGSAANLQLESTSGNVLIRPTGTTVGTFTSSGLTLTGTIITQNGSGSTPASAAATGTAGTIQWDASYIYVCTATNTWKRAAISTW